MNVKRPCLFRTRLLTPSLLSAVLLLVSLNRASAAQNLPCGITHGTISSLRQTNLYSLAGVAGDVLRITSAGTAGGVCPEIEIVDVGNIACGDSYSTLMLPTNGIYNVRVYDSGNSHTGGYDLSVTYATEKWTAIPLQCGVITNTFTISIQQHTYTFSGNEGDVIRLTSASLTGDVCPDMEVFQSGTYLASFGCYDSFSTLTLPATGTYVVLARERSLDRTGSYALGLAFATSKCAIEIGCGTITNEFTSFVQQHAYTISGN